MKRVAYGTFVVVMMTGIGCSKSGEAGGPGVTKSDSNIPRISMQDNTFQLTTTTISTKAGDQASGTIGIKRGTNFADDVTITFVDLPQGVQASPVKLYLKHSETESKFAMVANAEAIPGEYTVKIIGHPGSGPDATNDFKLVIGKKDTFTIGSPFWTPGVKQGETKSMNLSISRDSTFNEAVTIQFAGLPKGVIIEPSQSVIQPGETTAKFNLKADADAALGDFTVKVTGHPMKGTDAMHELKFTIAKK